jgi:hypothetical protein
VRNEEILNTVKEEKNTLYKIKRRKINWIGHILSRNSLLKHAIEGKSEGGIDVTGRQHKQLLDDVKEMEGYWKLKMKALDCTLWRTCFGRSYEPVV